MVVGTEKVRVQLPDWFMDDPVAGKWIGLGDVRGGEAAGTDCREFHHKGTH